MGNAIGARRSQTQSPLIYGGVKRALPGRSSLCLIEGTTVAGTRHVGGIRERAAAYEPGERFAFVRDHDNLYDEWAVRVYDASRERVGYVSCECSEIVARLLDGGRRVHGRFEGVSQVENWTRIAMGVYLDD